MSHIMSYIKNLSKHFIVNGVRLALKLLLVFTTLNSTLESFHVNQLENVALVSHTFYVYMFCEM